MKQTLSLIALIMLLAACGDRNKADAGTAQHALDSTLLRQLDSAKTLLRKTGPEQAEPILLDLDERTKGRLELRKTRISILAVLGRMRQRQALHDAALAHFSEGLRTAEEIRDTAGIGSMWLNLGSALESKGDYAGALEAQLTALRWKEMEGDEHNTARVLHNLSLLYWRQDSLDQAIQLLERSISIKRVSDSLNLANGLNGLGVLLIEGRQYDSAIATLHESLQLEQHAGIPAERHHQLVNLGLAHERNGALDSAEHYYALSLQDALVADDPLVEVRALYGLGDVRRAQGRYREAGVFLDSALAKAQRAGSLEDTKEAHGSLALLYETAGDPQRALRHYKAQHQLSDSLMSVDTETRMHALRLRYANERNVRENQELRITAALSTLRAERERWVALGLAVLACVIALVSWTVVQRNHQRARQREAELEQQALRLQMDPHFLFNALNTVPGLYASGDVHTANDHVGHLSRFLRIVLQTSRRRTIPLAQELELVEHYLRINANRRPGSFTWQLHTSSDLNTERVAIPPMLIQPIVENAMEHGIQGRLNGHIAITIHRHAERLRIQVSDNGVGRSSAAERPARRTGNSMGLDLVRQRIVLFNGRNSSPEAVLVRDEQDSTGKSAGTTVILDMQFRLLNEQDAGGDRG